MHVNIFKRFYPTPACLAHASVSLAFCPFRDWKPSIMALSTLPLPPCCWPLRFLLISPSGFNDQRNKTGETILGTGWVPASTAVLGTILG